MHLPAATICYTRSAPLLLAGNGVHVPKEIKQGWSKRSASGRRAQTICLVSFCRSCRRACRRCTPVRDHIRSWARSCSVAGGGASAEDDMGARGQEATWAGDDIRSMFHIYV